MSIILADVCEPEPVCPDRKRGKDKPCVRYIPPDDSMDVGLCSKPDKFLCIESLKHKCPRLSYSQADTFSRCRYMYYLRYVQGIRVKPTQQSGSIKMGTLWDKACNEYDGELVIDQALAESLRTDPFDLAKVNALARAANELGIDVTVDPITGDKFAPQYEITKRLESVRILAYLDGITDDRACFVERKCSARPDRYLDIHNLNGQIATYFMMVPESDRCVMQIVRVSSLRKGSDSPEDFEERIVDDILNRPKYYFQGYTGNNTFGISFTRQEFDIDSERIRYQAIGNDIKGCAARNEWYRNRNACVQYGTNYPCDYLPICDRSGKNETIYVYADKKIDG